MPLMLTVEADVRCEHKVGRMSTSSSQSFVRISGSLVIVGEDPRGRRISGCPNAGVAIKPCQNTLQITAGKSGFVRVDGKPVIRGDLVGITDGTPPGSVPYRVMHAGQAFVLETP